MCEEGGRRVSSARSDAATWFKGFGLSGHVNPAQPRWGCTHGSRAGMDTEGSLNFLRRLEVIHRVLSRLVGPVVPSFRALYGRLKLTVRRHKFNEDSLCVG